MRHIVNAMNQERVIAVAINVRGTMELSVRGPFLRPVISVNGVVGEQNGMAPQLVIIIITSSTSE